MQHYLDHDQKLKKFVHIIKDSVVYPVLYDSQRTVLSLPPVINGAHSAVRLSLQHQSTRVQLLLDASGSPFERLPTGCFWVREPAWNEPRLQALHHDISSYWASTLHRLWALDSPCRIASCFFAKMMTKLRCYGAVLCCLQDDHKSHVLLGSSL